MFYDTEHDKYITAAELENEYNELKAENGTDAKTFRQYVSFCLVENNGTLERV